MMFLECPAYLDQDSAVRCGLPAEGRCRFTIRSTDGPLESAMIWCPAGHYFNGPIEFLARDSTGHYYPGAAGLGHDGRYGGGGFALRAFPAAPERKVRRPNTALAYYLGHRVDHCPAPVQQGRRLPIPDGSRRRAEPGPRPRGRGVGVLPGG